jgi:hypothetical protein
MRIVYFLLFFILCICNGCEKQKETFCGVCDPANDLIWLKEIINIAETHQNFNYIGSIYAEVYSKKDVVYVEMSLGDSGLVGHWFNCDGSALIFTSDNPPKATKSRLIYKSYN